MGVTTVGVLKDHAPGERRVALVPDVVQRVRAAGLDVVVETGAGAGAWFADADYVAAQASVLPAQEVYARADVLLRLDPPDPEDTHLLHPGQTLIGMLEPLQRPEHVRRLAEQGVTAVSLDMLPRTLSRAQAMDALTSQANVAGYHAALLAAAAYGGYFPMVMTAAGTAKPAAVLILGAGVAGLQAIGTARRLGAVVTGYDVRPETKNEIESLGARFLDLPAVDSAGGTGGYARELTAEERAAQQAELGKQLARFDVVITTARVPGRRPPLLVTGEALAGMRPGSVVLDMGASELGGNVAGSAPDDTVVVDGVTVLGPTNLAAAMPMAASNAYARNVAALLTHLVHDGALAIDLTDEIQAGVVVTHAGSVVHPAVAELVAGLVAGGSR